jgi:hypothetical protein
MGCLWRASGDLALWRHGNPSTGRLPRFEGLLRRLRSRIGLAGLRTPGRRPGQSRCAARARGGACAGSRARSDHARRLAAGRRGRGARERRQACVLRVRPPYDGIKTPGSPDPSGLPAESQGSGGAVPQPTQGGFPRPKLEPHTSAPAAGLLPADVVQFGRVCAARSRATRRCPLSSGPPTTRPRSGVR